MNTLLTPTQCGQLETFHKHLKRGELDYKKRSAYVFGPAKDFSELYAILDVLKIGYYAEYTAPIKQGTQSELFNVFVIGQQAEKLSIILVQLGLEAAQTNAT